MNGPRIVDHFSGGFAQRPPSVTRPDPSRFHSAVDGYCPGPLVDAPGIAKRLGIGSMSVKLESSRFGLPAFKALGAFYAAHLALCRALSKEDPWSVEPDSLSDAARDANLVLTAATDGNHGRAVARYAAILGLRSRIFLPDGTAPARCEAIDSELGASTRVVNGTYLDAVGESVSLAQRDSHCVLVSDISCLGTGPSPEWVIDGYATIFSELEDELSRQDQHPSLLSIQVGAGALACAAGRWNASRKHPAAFLTVEPADSACLLESLRAGTLQRVPGPHRSVMAGLNCDMPSRIAFDELKGQVSVAATITDEASAWAVQALAAEGIEAGESGAAGLAGVAAVALDPGSGELRTALGIDGNCTAVVVLTEGPTDPDAAARSLEMELRGWPSPQG